MLQVARLAPKLLGDSTSLVADFFVRQQNDDGGFRNRDGASDLYYTVFGLSALLALADDSSPGAAAAATDLGTVFARAAQYVGSAETTAGLDFVHLCCHARCLAAVSLGIVSPKSRDAILAQIEKHRARDGGYNPVAENDFGTVYAGFLALGAYQDLRAEMPEPLRLVQSLKFLEHADGGWANDCHSRSSATNATAAAITMLQYLGMPVSAATSDWMLARAHRDGGFVASAETPLPDLLSTATTLHALAAMDVSFEPLRERCLDFIDSLWTNEGGFHGHWADDDLDCEYTFYGLLALGHLALPRP